MKEMSGDSEFVPFFDDDRRKTILHGLFDSYYANIKEGQVVFDTNRAWTGKTALLRELYPRAHIICCVRDVGWVIDSMERMLRANPLQLSRIFAYQPGNSVYSRVEILMNSESGSIGRPWSTLREAWFGESADRLIIVPYETLIRESDATLRKLYEAIEKPHFNHNFENALLDEPGYDAQLGMPGLHRVRPVVKPESRELSIPPDVFAKYAITNFWAKPELNHRKVRIL